MTSFTERMPFVEYKVVGFVFIFTLIVAGLLLGAFGARSGRLRRVEEWISAFTAEEVKFMVVASAEFREVESDEARINNGGLAMEAHMSVFLL